LSHLIDSRTHKANLPVTSLAQPTCKLLPHHINYQEYALSGMQIGADTSYVITLTLTMTLTMTLDLYRANIPTHIHRDKVIAISTEPYYVVDTDNCWNHVPLGVLCTCAWARVKLRIIACWLLLSFTAFTATMQWLTSREWRCISAVSYTVCDHRKVTRTRTPSDLSAIGCHVSVNRLDTRSRSVARLQWRIYELNLGRRLRPSSPSLFSILSPLLFHFPSHHLSLPYPFSIVHVGHLRERCKLPRRVVKQSPATSGFLTILTLENMFDDNGFSNPSCTAY